MKIGPINIDRPLALAPMEDVTDAPFRKICKEFGADLMYTEFANCEALIRNVKNAYQKITIDEEERPVAIQLYGSQEESMERAAEIAQWANPDFIDINCGCWVKKIAMRGDGAGLLRDLDKFQAVVASVMRGTSLPVTVKTRLGWDDDSIVILEVAQMLEAMGVQALTIHCRTRKQGYRGTADWSWIPKIKEASNMPLIANGDIMTPEDAEEVFKLGADGIMIGRGAIQSPWIFQHIKHYLETGEKLPEPVFRDKIALCIRHLRAHVAYRGERRGVSSFRKNYHAYLKGVRNVAHLRNELMQLYEMEPIIERLQRFVVQYEAENAALHHRFVLNRLIEVLKARGDLNQR